MLSHHVTIDPAILYFGTPVALIGSVDEDGRPNLAPISSVFWLGHTAVLGIGARAQTALNLQASGECTINLPSVAEVDAVDRLALTTGRSPVSARKAAAGYRHEPDKFGHAGLTAVASELVTPPRVGECPVNMEGRVAAVHGLEMADPARAAGTLAIEVEILRVHVHPSIRSPSGADRVDPDRWRPLMMSFQRFYGLGDESRPSRLASIDEEWYRPKPAPAVA
jgi:flavin reductase (DIM6/NTAB) family NADH-FMN oxidoreductase RutF